MMDISDGLVKMSIKTLDL